MPLLCGLIFPLGKRYKTMSTKQDLIKEMIAMQHKFSAYEREHGVSMKEYFMPEDDDELAGYRKKYNDMAMKLVDIAHEEKGSVR